MITLKSSKHFKWYSKTPIYRKPRFTADDFFPPKPGVNRGFTLIILMSIEMCTIQFPYNQGSLLPTKYTDKSTRTIGEYRFETDFRGGRKQKALANGQFLLSITEARCTIRAFQSHIVRQE